MLQDDKIILNLNYNRYLSKRLDEPIQNIEQRRILNIKGIIYCYYLNSTYKNIAFKVFYKLEKRKEYILTLIGNQEFTEDIFFKEIISEIFLGMIIV